MKTTKENTAENPTTTTAAATDWRQALRMMALAALVIVLVVAGLGIAAARLGWLEKPGDAGIAVVLVIIAAVAYTGWRGLTEVWQHTWPKAVKPTTTGPAYRRRRNLLIDGQPVDFGWEDEADIVPGLDWPIEKVQRAFDWAQTHGLTDGAWQAGPLKDAELRSFREWLARHGLAGKTGRARTSPWQLQGDLDDLARLIERL